MCIKQNSKGYQEFEIPCASSIKLKKSKLIQELNEVCCSFLSDFLYIFCLFFRKEAAWKNFLLQNFPVVNPKLRKRFCNLILLENTWRMHWNSVYCSGKVAKISCTKFSKTVCHCFVVFVVRCCCYCCCYCCCWCCCSCCCLCCCCYYCRPMLIL
jgi:hypothetical protein